MLTSPPTDKHLTGSIRSVKDLGAAERQWMQSLLNQFFGGVSAEGFVADLQEKEAVILLHDPHSQIQGFSTLMRFEHTGAVVFFSGDTVIHPDFWGSPELPRQWGRYVFGQAAELRRQQAGLEVYWLLISAGYKTYRFLPTFFLEFYPTYHTPTPPRMQTLMESFAHHKFGAAYQAGIVRLAQATPLRPGVADPEPRHLQDPHIAFFLSQNPGHVRGDELVCLTRVHPDNLSAAGLRMIR